MTDIQRRELLAAGLAAASMMLPVIGRTASAQQQRNSFRPGEVWLDSRDLYNWDDAGIIIPPEPNDPTSPLHPNQYTDRPHIL